VAWPQKISEALLLNVGFRSRCTWVANKSFDGCLLAPLFFLLFEMLPSTNKMQHPVPNLLLSAKNVHFEIDLFLYRSTTDMTHHHIHDTTLVWYIKGLLYTTHVFAKQYISETFQFLLCWDQQLVSLNKKCSVVKSVHWEVQSHDVSWWVKWTIDCLTMAIMHVGPTCRSSTRLVD